MKRISAFLAVVTLLTSIGAPVYATTPQSSVVGSDLVFCNSVGTLDATLTSAIAAKAAKVQANREKADKKLADLRFSALLKLVDYRTKDDQKWYTHFENLAKKADTDYKKAQVELYKTTVKAALEEKRNANATLTTVTGDINSDTPNDWIVTSGALKVFRNGQDAAIQADRVARDSLTATYNTALHAAVAKAVTACQQTPDQGNIQQTLLSDFKAAQKTYKIGLVKLQPVKSKVAKLTSTLRATRVANSKTFQGKQKAALKVLQEALKTALKTAPNASVVKKR